MKLALEARDVLVRAKTGSGMMFYLLKLILARENSGLCYSDHPGRVSGQRALSSWSEKK